MRNIINKTVVDFQQPVSIFEATARCHSSWHYIPDYVTMAALLHPQMEAVRLSFLSFKNTQTWVGRWHRVWPAREILAEQSFFMLWYKENRMYMQTTCIICDDHHWVIYSLFRIKWKFPAKGEDWLTVSDIRTTKAYCIFFFVLWLLKLYSLN